MQMFTPDTIAMRHNILHNISLKTCNHGLLHAKYVNIYRRIIFIDAAQRTIYECITVNFISLLAPILRRLLVFANLHEVWQQR